MRQHEAEIGRLGLQVAVVTFQSGPVTQAYVRDTRLPWPLLVDGELSLYRSYGMERGKWRNIFGAASIASYVKLMLRGRKPSRREGDPFQLGGDVLIDPQGIVRLHHVGRGPADRPSVASILQVAQSATAGQ